MLNCLLIFIEILQVTPKLMAYRFIMMAVIPLCLKNLSLHKVLYLERFFFFFWLQGLDVEMNIDIQSWSPTQLSKRRIDFTVEPIQSFLKHVVTHDVPYQSQMVCLELRF